MGTPCERRLASFRRLAYIAMGVKKGGNMRAAETVASGTCGTSSHIVA